nr:MAG TPA: Endoplasmic oxidoreductin-1 [Bacteriophage sp.]
MSAECNKITLFLYPKKHTLVRHLFIQMFAFFKINFSKKCPSYWKKN